MRIKRLLLDNLGNPADPVHDGSDFQGIHPPERRRLRRRKRKQGRKAHLSKEYLFHIYKDTKTMCAPKDL